MVVLLLSLVCKVSVVIVVDENFIEGFGVICCNVCFCLYGGFVLYFNFLLSWMFSFFLCGFYFIFFFGLFCFFSFFLLV